MDSKGKTIAIATIGPKILIRENTTTPTHTTIKFFGLDYNSWHAETRIIFSIIKNKYLLKLAETCGIEMVVERFTRSGKLAGNSKPCTKCQKMLSLVSKKYNIRINVFYWENEKRGKITYQNI